MPQPEANDLSGQEIGGHHLVDLLGRGSMGSIYSVEHPTSALAIKVLHPHIAADALRVRRFRREAKAAMGLNHAAIVHLCEFGHDDVHGPFIVMERLEGENLVERTVRSSLTPSEAVQVFEQVLAALAHAHEHGIIHRDLKAENVVVHEGKNGLVAKVCDFGMVKMLNEEGTAITAEGLVCGTPEYMSPEQARGDELDGRADIYALGCLLYLVLTGSLPFQGKNAVDTLGQQLVRPVPSPRRACPERNIPVDLDKVVRRAMAKAPAARYQSADEMRDAMLSAELHTKEKQHGRVGVVLLVLVGLLVLGLALVLAR